MMRTLQLTALFFLSCMVLPGGCAGNKHQAEKAETRKDTIMISLGSDFRLNHDQTAFFESEGFSIKFLNVTEDSRCPVGVECIWPGQAKIVLEISTKNEPPEIITLTSLAGQDDPAIRQFEGYFIRLVSVEPPRRPNQELPLSDYLITLNFSRSPDSARQ